jgi:hypothetical protein
MRNEEPHYLYSSPSVTRVIRSRRMRWAGHVARFGERGCAYWVLVGKPGGETPLVRTSEDNIKIDIQLVGLGAWTGLIWLTTETSVGML